MTHRRHIPHMIGWRDHQSEDRSTGGCTQARRSRKPPEIIPGGFLVYRHHLPGTTNTMLRILVAAVALVAVTTMLLLHATHHGAHAKSATHCGFWTEIEAGLSCR